MNFVQLHWAIKHPLVLILFGFSLSTGIFVLFWLSKLDILPQHSILDPNRPERLNMLVKKSVAEGRNANPSLPTHDERLNFNDDLKDKVRVFCWIMTSPTNIAKARAVKATWLKRCNGYVFVSTEHDPDLPSVNASVGEGRDFLWGKTKFGFRYAYDTALNDYDWFVKADDDTYMILEHLRRLLANYSSAEPIYFGCRFKPLLPATPQGYMSGGAGYVLSRQALRLFIEEGLDKDRCDSEDSGDEDIQTGFCLYDVGVRAMNSRDEFGQERFYPFLPSDHFEVAHANVTTNESWWSWYAEYHPDLDCCSDTAISFHYVTENEMYAFDYLIYHLSPLRRRQKMPHLL